MEGLDTWKAAFRLSPYPGVAFFRRRQHTASRLAGHESFGDSRGSCCILEVISERGADR